MTIAPLPSLRSLLCLLALTLAAPPIAVAQFGVGDLAGTWSLYSRWDGPTVHDPGFSRGNLTIDASGNVTGGSITDVDGTVETVTAGSFTVTPAGKVAGTVTTAGGSEALSDFQLDLAGDLLVGTDTDTDGFVNLVVAVRRSGTFSTADIAGTWYLYAHWDDRLGLNDAGWTRAEITFNAAGTVTASPVVIDHDGPGVAGELNGLDVNINAAGTGVIAIPPEFTDSEFQMTPDKQAFFGVLNDTDEGDSFPNLLVGVKVTGGATTADLEGGWASFTFFDRTGANGPRWTRSIFDVNNVGTATSGSKSNSAGGSAGLSSGSLSVDASSRVDGTLNFGALTSDRFVDAMLNTSRDLFAGVASGVAADDRRILSIAIAVPEPGTTGAALGVLAGLALLRRRRQRLEELPVR